MQETSKQVTARIINDLKPATILDAPCGKGWLTERLEYSAQVDGIDLFDEPRSAYRKVYACDLDYGLPESLPQYDCIASCEGIEHFGNPDLFLKTIKQHLKPGGTVVVTTPNIWYPEARLQFMLRGFFPGFPCLTGRIERGNHMHIMPWSYPQLFLYFKLNGYHSIKLYEEPMSRHKHWWEKALAWPQKIYCRGKLRKAKTEEERDFWKVAMSGPSLFGRHLIMTAQAS